MSKYVNAIIFRESSEVEFEVEEVIKTINSNDEKYLIKRVKEVFKEEEISQYHIKVNLGLGTYNERLRRYINSGEIYESLDDFVNPNKVINIVDKSQGMINKTLYGRLFVEIIDNEGGELFNKHERFIPHWMERMIVDIWSLTFDSCSNDWYLKINLK